MLLGGGVACAVGYPVLWLGRKFSEDAEYSAPRSFPLGYSGWVAPSVAYPTLFFPSALSLGSFPSHGSKAHIRSTQDLE